MPPSVDITTHQPQLDVLQRALESPKGVKVSFATEAEAKRFQLTLYHARAAQARFHKKVYPPEHPLHNKSYYESLTTRCKGTVVEIIHADNQIFNVEEL